MTPNSRERLPLERSAIGSDPAIVQLGLKSSFWANQWCRHRAAFHRVALPVEQRFLSISLFSLDQRYISFSERAALSSLLARINDILVVSSYRRYPHRHSYRRYPRRQLVPTISSSWTLSVCSAWSHRGNVCKQLTVSWPSINDQTAFSQDALSISQLRSAMSCYRRQAYWVW